MVLGVWELVLFLWSHPIISCLVLLLFSPPFFPIVVFFSPLLICTGLVAVAMISMNMGERAAVREDLRNGTRRLHEPAAHHSRHGEMLEKPAREGWLQWMKKREEKAKAWIDGRFLNQEKWQFRSTSALRQEEESRAVGNDNDEGHRISSYRIHPIPVRPTPIQTSRDMSPPQADGEVPPPLSEDAKASEESSNSSVPAAEDIIPITRGQALMEDCSFSFPIVEQRSPPSLVVPLAAGVEEDILKDGIGVPSSPKQEEAPSVAKVETVVAVEKEMPSAPKPEITVEEQPTANFRSEPRSSEGKVPLVSPPQEEVLPPAGIDENSTSQLPEKDEGSLTTKEGQIRQVGESVTSTDSTAFVPDSDQVTKVVEALLVESETTGGHPGIPVSVDSVQNSVEDESKSLQSSAGSHGSSRLTAVEVLVEDRKASPEAEVEIFSPSKQPEDVLQPPTERFITTEKIIFIDELSKFPTGQSRSMVVEAGQVETGQIIDKSIGKVVVLVTEEPPIESGSKNLEDRSPEDHGLDENIESCADVPPPSTTSTSSVQYSESLALVRRSSSEGSLSETNAMLLSAPRPINDLELLTEYMEPMMSSIYNDAALMTSTNMLDKSYSLNTAFAGGEEHDDLMARFYELKKSMSFHTTRRLEEPISITVSDAANIVVPVYVPDTVTRVDRDPLAETVVFPEKKLLRPGFSSGNVESVESITARLLSKFTPNLGSDAIRTRPPSRPVPALPAIATASSVETEKSLAIAPALSVESVKKLAIAPDLSVESDESLAVAPVSSVESSKSPEAALTSNESEKSAEKGREDLVLPVDVATIAVKANSHSKKSLTAFLSRRRDRLMSSQPMEAASVSDEGEKGGTMSSGAAETVTSAEISTEDRDEGLTAMSSGRHLKEKMISPLKRVFSMDANSNSNRKEDSWRVMSVKRSPVKEKQSVIDKSKDRFMKLFSSDGGLTKLETVDLGKIAEPDAISLRKSKSASKTGELKAELRDDAEVVEDAMSLPTTPQSGPSSEGHGMIVSEGVDSEKFALPVIEAASLSDTAELVTSKCEPLPTSAPAEETEPDNSAKSRGNSVIKSSSSEKKKSWSWTKKKRSSEPQDQFPRSPDCSVLSGQAIDEECKVILMSPLTRFHSSSTVDEKAVTASSLVENHASEFKFSHPDLNSNLRDSPKADSSVQKKSSTSWRTPKTDPPPPAGKVKKAEKVEKPILPPKAKKVSTSWWTKKSNNRPDTKAVQSSSLSAEVPPTDNITTSSITADGIEKSGLLLISSPTALEENDNQPRHDDSCIESSNRLRKDIFQDDNDEAVAARPWHRRERSESLPSRGRFSRLRGRQTSLSDFTLPRTPELLSPGFSSGMTAIDNNNSRRGDGGAVSLRSSSGSSTSILRTDENYQQQREEPVKGEKRNCDALDSSRSSRSNNLGWRSRHSPTPPPSFVKTLDLANEHLRVRSPFHRSDLDVNSGNSRLYRNSAADAQIRITDKFKVPLEEVLSLLSTGDSDEQHHLTTADNRTATGGAVAGDDLRAASSSSSSEEETSSEEEWSATSDEEDEKSPETVQHFTPLVPAPGRIRRRLPHYIFSRGEPTAN